ncbi:MAG: hypothetical protein D8M59_03190 [Planctomycetes bacterium]|nr:hypothetical protein [Planctomycetota bacterium]NOG53000.1 hypothetical protein [Planctomycetota bacterium]
MLNAGIIYAACVAGAVGVLLMLPRRGSQLALLGGLIGAASLGAALLAVLNVTQGADPPVGERPGVFFIVLAFVAAAGAARMITHPRPVYAALYFILVILASAGLLVLLAAEFMAFALVIVYAGAILVTYLFVIMFAQQAAEEGQEANESAPYDLSAREPVAAVAAGFIMLAALLGLMYRGTGQLDSSSVMNAQAAARMVESDPAFALLVQKAERALADQGTLEPGETVAWIESNDREAWLTREDSASAESGAGRLVTLPGDFQIDNVERLGLSLMSEFPASLEVAGVILLMAMLGAVVLSRKIQPLMTPAGGTDTGSA